MYMYNSLKGLQECIFFRLNNRNIHSQPCQQKYVLYDIHMTVRVLLASVAQKKKDSQPQGLTYIGSNFSSTATGTTTNY